MVQDQTKLCVTKLNKTSTTSIDKICLYIKDPFQLKYRSLINRREKAGIKILKNPQAFILFKQVIMSLKIQKTRIQQRKVLVLHDGSRYGS